MRTAGTLYADLLAKGGALLKPSEW